MPPQKAQNKPKEKKVKKIKRKNILWLVDTIG